jgi:hypothetical protein
MHVDFSDAPREMIQMAMERTPHLAEPLKAVLDHGCRFVVVSQGPRGFRVHDGPPAIVILGDDLNEALGPGGFNAKAVNRYLASCGGVVIVACEAMPCLYEAAAGYAVDKQENVAIIETQPHRIDEWVLVAEAARPGIRMLIGDVRPAKAH